MDYKEYLDTLSPDEKEYTINFFKRKDYIEKLNETVINNYEGTILSGKGNCNSKIAVIVDYHTDLDIVTKFISPMFESINTSLWNIYITCLIKAGNGKDIKESDMWIEMMKHEMNAISPSFVFKFCRNYEGGSFTKKELSVFNKTFPVVYIDIDDVKYVLDKDNFKSDRYIQIMNDFYKYVLEIIQYREIELAE